MKRKFTALSGFVGEDGKPVKVKTVITLDDTGALARNLLHRGKIKLVPKAAAKAKTDDQ